MYTDFEKRWSPGSTFFFFLKKANLHILLIRKIFMYRKNISLIAFSLFIATLLSAQSARGVLLNVQLEQNQSKWTSEVLEIPLIEAEPFIAFSMIWEKEAEFVEVRFASEKLEWEDWQTLPLEIHAEQRTGHWVSQLYFANKESRYVQIKAQVNLGNIEAHFYNPGASEKQEEIVDAQIEQRDPDSCPCPQPAYEGRLDWCPDGTCPEDATPVNTNVTHLIVHHSAGTNSSSNWAAVVRSIWDFHTGVNGWDDIGYNWLVDPNGVIYEGRGDDRLGAHFCGTNGGTMGVCVLGDFTNITPTNNAISGLTTLLAWKACDVNVDPQGSAFHGNSGLTLNRISGHRDGCATSCPGDSFYPLFDGVREGVADYIASACSSLGAPNNLTALATSETSIELNWEDVTDNETSFELERSTSFNGTYELIATLGENEETYEDTGLTPSTGYYYQVRALSDDEVSAYSNRAFAFTIIVNTEEVAPENEWKVFPNPTSGNISIQWEQAISGALQVNLVNAVGQLVKSASVPGAVLQHDVNMQTLAPGVYWLEIHGAETLQVVKVIKE